MSTTKFPSATGLGLDGKSNCNVCEKLTRRLSPCVTLSQATTAIGENRRKSMLHPLLEGWHCVVASARVNLGNIAVTTEVSEIRSFEMVIEAAGTNFEQNNSRPDGDRR